MPKAYRRISKERQKKGAQLRRLVDQAYSVSPRQATIGQPTKYRPAFCELATRHCMLGATNEELGDLFGVTKETVQDWMRTKPEFKDAIYKGRDGADAKIAESLFHRARGFSHFEEVIKITDKGKVHRAKTIKQYPPDTGAAKFILTNRRAAKERQDGNAWADRVEHAGPGGGPVDIAVSYVAASPPPPKEKKA